MSQDPQELAARLEQAEAELRDEQLRNEQLAETVRSLTELVTRLNRQIDTMSRDTPPAQREEAT